MENKPADLTPPAEKTPEEIEREMLQTRQSLTAKVAALEQTVVGNIQSVTQTVEQVKEAVKDTMSSVREGVTDTVETVKHSLRDTFDIPHHVRERPLLAVGISAAAGFFAGFLTGGGRRSLGATADTPVMPTRAADLNYAAPPPAPRAPGMFEKVFDGVLGDLLGKAGQEVRRLAEDALATAVAAVKQNIHTTVPHLIDSAVSEVVPAAGRSNGAGYPARG